MAQIYTQVKLATWEDVNLATAWALGVDSLDGVLVSENARVLVKSQSNRTQNGIYYFNAFGILTRASDFALGSTQTGGGVVFIQEGYIHADTGWVISSNGSLTVGSDDILFEKFSVNLKLQGADVPSSIVLRQEKGYPLTNDELDNNFKYLAVSLTQKLNIIDFTSIAVRDKINALSAAQANLDAWRLQGNLPAIDSLGNTIAVRDENADLTALVFHGDLNGNADTATNADYADTAHVLDSINPIIYGGTGADTIEDARSNLETVWLGGDTMTGQLVLPSAEAEYASLRVPPLNNAPVNLFDGDIWSDNEFMYYSMNNVTQTFARTDSPTFTGSTTYTEDIDIESNSYAVANTAYVQKHRSEIDTELGLKSPIESPEFTGTPLSVTANTNAVTQNNTMIATLEYVANKIADVLTAYSTALEVTAEIATALESYYTSTQVDSAISTALESYYTSTQVDNTLSSYYTSSEVDTNISNAVAGLASESYVDDRQGMWGSSKKFVQSTQPSSSESADGDFWFKI
jgi:hypothetical protein